jgi:hypothetical protein
MFYLVVQFAADCQASLRTFILHHAALPAALLDFSLRRHGLLVRELAGVGLLRPAVRVQWPVRKRRTLRQDL